MTSVAAAFILFLGAWSVQFDESNQNLTLARQDGTSLTCRLEFSVDGQSWRVERPRDAVPSRLVLVDPNNNAQGYISFNAQGDRLEALVYHRTRQFYNGKLVVRGEIAYKEDAFLCRTSPRKDERVLAFSSGNVASSSFDSLFSTENDEVLRLTAPKLLFERPNPDARGKFQFEAELRIEEAAEATFDVEIDKDYFKKRWVPYYRPIDRKRCPSPPTGWMSWNTYFDKATAEDNLAEARIGREILQPFGCEIWSIESWQGNSDQLPVSNFYNLDLEYNEKQFPEGMKKLADDIRALGFKPGLWTAPFGTGSKDFYEKHKDWFLHDKNGTPIRAWNGIYMIDPSNDEVVDWLRRIHEVASKEWGYEYFKIDGMSGSGPGYCAHLYELPEVRAAFKNPNVEAPFERCVKALREGIGDDRIFLACQGHFTGPEAQYADAARTGADIVHPNQPVRWENIKQQGGRTLNQIFVNNIVFFSDPDNLLVNEDLPLEEARVTTTIVALPGQLTFFGDKLAKLPPERVRLLQQTLPVCDVRPSALYPYFSYLPVWDLKIGRSFGAWDVVALFNWTDEPQKIGCSLEELGLAQGRYCAFEFWTQRYLGETEERFELDVPERAVRLLAVHRVLERPQFLSSDRHVSQGGVDLRDAQWDEETKTLKASFALVANHKTTARFRVPKGFELKSARCDEVELKTYSEDNGEVLVAEITSPTSDARELVLSF